MQIKWQFLLWTLLTSFFFWIPVFAATPANVSQTVTPAAITFSDPHKIIQVREAAPTFKIFLQANPTTGYAWFIKQIDSNLIQVRHHKYVAPGSKLVGAPGYEEWKFQVKPAIFKQNAETTVQLIYKRRWEKTYAQAVTFTVKTNE